MLKVWNDSKLWRFNKIICKENSCTFFCQSVKWCFSDWRLYRQTRTIPFVYKHILDRLLFKILFHSYWEPFMVDSIIEKFRTSNYMFWIYNFIFRNYLILKLSDGFLISCYKTTLSRFTSSGWKTNNAQLRNVNLNIKYASCLRLLYFIVNLSYYLKIKFLLFLYR